MSTNYPSALDSLTNPATTDPVNSPSHAVQHANANDAIEALQAKVGTDNSLITTSIDYRVRQLESNPTGTANKITQLIINNTGSTLAKGKAVYASGSVGASGKLRVSLSSNAAEATSSKTFGVLAESITNGGEGTVVTEGLLENIDTTGANDGDPIWLGTNGGLIFGLANKPYAPAHLVFLGTVVRGGNANNGSIFVKVQNGFELEELHNVAIASLADKDLVAYDNATGLWKNKTFNSLDIATQTYVNSAITSLSNTVDTTYVPISDVGNADGVAPLDSGGKIPDSYIPSGITRDTELSTAIANLVNSAPSTLDTLSEIATALGNDANLSTTLTNAIAGKVSKSGGDTITPSSASVKGLIVKAASSQTANLTEWQHADGTVMMSVLAPSTFGGSGYGSIVKFTDQGGAKINWGSNTVWGIGTIGSQTNVFYPWSSDRTAVIVQGLSGQTANLQEWQNSSGTILGKVDSVGNFTTNGLTALSNASFVYATAMGGIGIYTNKAILSVGTNNGDLDSLGILVRGKSGQTGDLQQWQASSGFDLAKITANGNMVFGNVNVDSNNYLSFIKAGGATGGNAGIRFGNDSAGSNQHTLTINTSNAELLLEHKLPNASFAIKGATSQTASLQEWKDASGNVVAKLYPINPGGDYTLSLFGAGTGSGSYSGILIGGGWIRNEKRSNLSKFGISTGEWHIAANPDQSAIAITDNQVGVFANSTSLTTFTIKAVASQTANLQEWQNSSGTVLSKVLSTGNFVVYGDNLNNFHSIGSSSTLYNGFTATTNTNSASYVIGTAGASESSFNVANSFYIYDGVAGVMRFKIMPTGLVGINSYSPASQLQINSSSASTITLIAKSAASQTADLQQWQNSAGTVLAKVDSSGSIFTNTASAGTNTTQVATTAFVKTAVDNLVASAPGALDTLNELAAALGNDANFSTTITNSLALKAPLASPTFTGTPVAPTATSGTNTTQIATTAFVKTAIDSSVQPGALYQTSAPTGPAVGQIWIDSDDDVTVFDSNIIRRQTFTATASQTSFTTDIAFIQGYEQVFMNGILLLRAIDYTTPTTTSVALATGATAGDIIDVITITNLNAVNTYTQAETNALIAGVQTWNPSSISTNTNLAAKGRYFVTSASALTLTLPANPSINDEIQILDASGNASTYNITVARNGKLINGGTGNLIIDTNGGWYGLIYTGSTYGWKVG